MSEILTVLIHTPVQFCIIYAAILVILFIYSFILYFYYFHPILFHSMYPFLFIYLFIFIMILCYLVIYVFIEMGVCKALMLFNVFILYICEKSNKNIQDNGAKTVFQLPLTNAEDEQKDKKSLFNNS